MPTSDFIFEKGEAIFVGSQGDTQTAYAGPEPIPNTGISEFVFEDGIGLGGGTEELIDDFEDGDKTVIPSNWSGWTGDTDKLKIVSSPTISGTFVGNSFASGGDFHNFQYATRDTETTDIAEFRGKMIIGNQTGESQDGVTFYTHDANNDILTSFLFKQDGELRVGGDTIIGTWEAGVQYEIRVYNFDFDNYTYSVEVLGGGSGGTETGIPFRQANNPVKRISMGNNNGETSQDVDAYFDDIFVVVE